MKAKYFSFLFLMLFFIGCRPDKEYITNNLTSNSVTWNIEFFQVYGDTWGSVDDVALDTTYYLPGKIKFESNRSGVLTYGTQNYNFSWSIVDNRITFNFNVADNLAGTHPLIYYAFAGTNLFCDDDVKSYDILKSEEDIHIFRYRVLGSCSHQTFNMIEWTITK